MMYTENNLLQVSNLELQTVSPFDDVQQVLIYMPDISGFTEFVNNTDIEDSKHLIHDLLEVLVDSNILNLKIAEIQGDAIFFYHLGTPYNITKLESQAKKTFLDFQRALIKIEKEHPHLKGVSNLTIKIVVHFGLVSATEIKGLIKLMGKDIILAHRILKNNIKGKEYLLMTDEYIASQEKALVNNSFKWSELKNGKKKYEHFGTIHYKYVPLSPLRKLI